jgi:hypothetical protein
MYFYRSCHGRGAIMGSIVVLLALAAGAGASISIPSDGFNYGQNFNTLPASGSATWTNDSTIPAWFHGRTGNGTTIVANDGSSTAGNLYSYGTGTATERALGSLGSGNTAVGSLVWGVLFQNNTGSGLESVDISYVGEQWRNSAAAAQTVAFYYKVDNATSPGPPGTADFGLAASTTGWTAFTALDFTSPVTGGTAGALDGNLAANQTSLTSLLTFSSAVNNGKWVWIAWLDPDHSSSDHGLAIDTFSATFHTADAVVPEAASVLVWLVLCGTVFAGWKWHRRFL